MAEEDPSKLDQEISRIIKEKNKGSEEIHRSPLLPSSYRCTKESNPFINRRKRGIRERIRKAKQQDRRRAGGGVQEAAATNQRTSR